LPSAKARLSTKVNGR
jgi:hypothetical protein